jgi:hypothetical protein
LDFQPSEFVRGEQKEVVTTLTSMPGTFRVYSPSYSLPQQVAADHGVELADGVDPMALKSYADFMRVATGVPGEGYSVTIPAFETGNPSQDNAGYLPDADLLGLLNVRYVVAEFDLAVEGLVLQAKIGGTRIYENLNARPRAWIQPVGQAVGIGAKAVDRLTWSPNRIELAVRGPGMVVLSEVDYPGWNVQVDGQKAEVEVVGGLFRGVEVGPGGHMVEFRYTPVSVYYGLGSFGIGISLATGYWIWCKREKVS